MMHGPKIAPQKIPYARSVDVMPTILAWFGKTSPHHDGHNLLQPVTLPTASATQFAALETRYINNSGHTHDQHRPHVATQNEMALRTARVKKLEELHQRCQHKTEDRLTHEDRPNRLRTATCEVVDLALKTAYGDKQRMQTIQNQLR